MVASRSSIPRSVDLISSQTLSTIFPSRLTSEVGLTYVKFNFSDYTPDEITTTNVRFFVSEDTTGGDSFLANLYGIVDNGWSASDITWATGAPDHDGIDIVGIEDEDYLLASSSRSWDLILGGHYYDFDASVLISNNCSDRIASFIFQANTTDARSAVSATVHGAKSSHPPRLILFHDGCFEWALFGRHD
jgi:hypothetical protein